MLGFCALNFLDPEHASAHISTLSPLIVPVIYPREEPVSSIPANNNQVMPRTLIAFSFGDGMPVEQAAN